MSSPFPCFPEPYPWGSPVAPASPTGLYRTLWQLCDALGYPRMFPAAAMQCAGRIAKGDQWYGPELVLIMRWITRGAYPTGTARWLFPIGATYTTSFLTAGGASFCGPPFLYMRWYFAPIVVSGKPYDVWTCTDAFTAGFPSMRLDTGATFPLSTAPWANDQALPDAQLICKSTSPFDGIFHNPI